MQQEPSRCVVSIHNDSDYRLRLEVTGGYSFIHLDVKSKLTLNLLETIRNAVDKLAKEVSDNGEDYILAYSSDKKSVKFWNMVKPYSHIEKFGPSNKYYMAVWDLEEYKNGS